MGILRDIWILSNNGITVYSRVFDETINDQLFGALMSAINTFAEQISKKSLSSFELQNIRFSLIKREGFLFIANSARKVKEKKVLSELEKVAEKFYELYCDDLEKWDCDVSIFKNFEAEIKGNLEKRMETFWDEF